MRSENFCVLIVYSNTLHEIPKGEEEKLVMLFACFAKRKIRGCCWLKLIGTKKKSEATRTLFIEKQQAPSRSIM